MHTDKLENLMTRTVTLAHPQMTLAEAAKLMWDADCGFLPVVDPATNALCGVLTDRDACMAGMSRGQRLQDLPVSAAMSRAVHALRPEDSSQQAEELMARYQVRRVPVVDAAQHVVGVVSMNDLALSARDRDDEHELSRTLSAICRHRELPAMRPAAGPVRRSTGKPAGPVVVPVAGKSAGGPSALGSTRCKPAGAGS